MTKQRFRTVRVMVVALAIAGCGDDSGTSSTAASAPIVDQDAGSGLEPRSSDGLGGKGACDLLREANATLTADPFDLGAAAAAFRAAGDAGGLGEALETMAEAFEAGHIALDGRPVQREEMLTLRIPSLTSDEYDAALNRYADWKILNC